MRIFIYDHFTSLPNEVDQKDPIAEFSDAVGDWLVYAQSSTLSNKRFRDGKLFQCLKTLERISEPTLTLHISCGGSVLPHGDTFALRIDGWHINFQVTATADDGTVTCVYSNKKDFVDILASSTFPQRVSESLSTWFMSELLRVQLCAEERKKRLEDSLKTTNVRVAVLSRLFAVRGT